VFLNNRHYDPSTGVFVSVDPLVSKTMQPYIYGAANPVRFSDPSGLEPCPTTGCTLQEHGRSHGRGADARCHNSKYLCRGGGIRYSEEGAAPIQEALGNSTPRMTGDDGYNLVTDTSHQIRSGARWWVQRGFEGHAWDAPQIDGLYAQDLPWWLIVMWLGPDAPVGSAAQIIGRLPAAPNPVDYTSDPLVPFDRWSGSGERVPYDDSVMSIAEFLAFSADGPTVLSNSATPLTGVGPDTFIGVGLSLLAQAYVLTDWNWDPNVPVNPGNACMQLSGLPTWPPPAGGC